MQISVVCWSRAKDKSLILWFLQSLNSQTFTDFDVNIVCDRNFSKSEECNFLEFFYKQNLKIMKRTKFFTNNNSNFNPNHTWWASYVRNFWLLNAKWKFIQLFDDDNRVWPDFLAQCMNKWEEKTKKYNSDCIILPSLYFKDTEDIQNQWFSYFNYLQSRPKLYLLNWKTEANVQMFSGNWLFGKAEIFKKTQYDEQIAWISEDLDYTISLYEQWVQLWVFADLKVQHFEREKTKLEKAWIWSPAQAHQKSRNRFLFIKKHWNTFNRLQFYCCWLPWCVIWLSIKAICFWWKQRRNIIKGIFEWIKEWIQLLYSND